MDRRHPSPDPALASAQTADRLDSWKEIARHLKRDIRTAQRWEATEGLPVYRHHHGQQGSVYAYKSEVDHWWGNRRPSVQKQEHQEEQRNSAFALRTLPGHLRLILCAAIGIAIVFAFAEVRRLFHQHFSPRPASAGRMLTIAVLPFANLSADSDDIQLAEGITEDVISDLGETRTWRVIDRTSAMRFEGSHETLRQIAHQLHSDDVVEGTVARDSARIRIAAKLVDASTGRVLWSQKFNRNDSDLLLLENDISRMIANSVGVTLFPDSPPARPPTRASNPDARLDYFKARYFWNRRDPAGMQQAIDYFTKAIREDPNYAPAYAGLSDSFILSSAWNSVSPTVILSKAKQAAITAVELNPSLAEAHTSLAVVAYRHDWDFETADREFHEAITLKPSYSRAHEWYGVFLVYMGRVDEGISELRQAQSLDPFSPIIQSDLALSNYFTHRNQEALTQFHKILDADPDFIPALLNLGCILAASGKYTQARVELEKVAALTGNKSYLEELEPLVSAASGARRQSQKQIEDILRNWKPNEDANARVAFLYSEMGDKENTLRYLEKAYQDRSWLLVIIKVDPTFDFMRSDPRFQSIERRIGLIPSRPATRVAVGN